MLVYRVVPVLPGAKPGDPGHPEFIKTPQGSGRIDNPAHYVISYLSVTASGAVGETLAQHPVWKKSIFPFLRLPGSALQLCTFELPDGIRLADLDDAAFLKDRGLRPSQVVSTNRATTQAWSLKLWQEYTATGQAWEGARWWSRHCAEWPVMGVWGHSPKAVDVEPLDLTHIAVIDAARTLNRKIQP